MANIRPPADRPARRGLARGLRRLAGLGWLAVGAGVWGAKRPPAAAPTAGPPVGGGDRSSSARPRPAVLVVSPYSLVPTIHGGAVRIFNLAKRLAERAEVSLLIFGGGTDDPPQRAALESFCRRVFFQRCPENDPALDRWGLLPRSATRYAAPEVDDRIAAIIDAHRIDVVLLEYTEMGQFARACRGARTVLVEHDLSFRSHARQRRVGIDRRYAADDVLGRSGEWLRRYRFELAACRRVDQIHVMSTADLQLLARLLPDRDRRIRVIPNGVDTSHFHPPPPGSRRSGVLFVGSFPHLPNLDALDHLLAQVWTRVRQRLPGARLTVAGARPPQRVLELDGNNGITVAGEAPDLAPLYRDHQALAVPLRAGSGTRLKILEAMACGLPVVSTTIGAEGIAGRPGQHLLVADEPAAFADALIELLGADDGAAARLAENGRALAVDHYGWDGIADRLREAVDELTPAAPRAPETAAAAGSEPPLASIVMPVAHGGNALERCLDGVSRQRGGASVEILCVDCGLAAVDRALVARCGARLVPGPGPAAGLGAAINAGARAARGTVLVLLAANAVPADTEWLSRLLAPFAGDLPPAAVQGGIQAQFVHGGPPYDPFFTAETRRWRQRMGGFAFSAVNAAVRRDVWERLPAVPAVGLADRRWQRELVANAELILPCWAAAVHWIRPLRSGEVLRAAWREGRHWRRLGVRYRLGELIGDLRRGTGPAGSSGELAPVPPGELKDAHRRYGLLRPPALFLGNRLAWRPAAARYNAARVPSS